jgi:ABC-type glycerol-3-phosphate transport system substrate-binding protein
VKHEPFSPRRRKIAITLAVAGASVAMTAAAGSGVSYASEGKPEGIHEASMSADGQFLKSGPHTVVKVTAGGVAPWAGRSEL